MSSTLRGWLVYTTLAYISPRSSKSCMSTSLKPSSSSFQQPYSSSGSNDSLFNIGSRRWIRLLFLTLVLYLVFLPLWWYSLQMLATVSGVVANWIYGLFDPRVAINPDGRVVRVFVTTSAIGEAQSASSGLRLDTVTYGLPMLAALVIVTRADSILAKVRALLIGLAVMLVLTVPAVLAWAKLTSLEIDQKTAFGGGDRSSLLFYAFHGYAFSQPVVAVAIWLALMMLGLFKARPKRETPVIAIHRNAPCPCGSGRKYKRCCGGVSAQ